VATHTHHRNDSNWETLAQCRKIACICALFKTYMGEWVWKAIGRVDHDMKIKSRKQKTDIGKYSFVNRTIQIWNPTACSCFRNSLLFRKVINQVK
jgi:hypothetical protein